MCAQNEPSRFSEISFHYREYGLAPKVYTVEGFVGVIREMTNSEWMKYCDWVILSRLHSRKLQYNGLISVTNLFILQQNYIVIRYLEIYCNIIYLMWQINIS